MLSRHFQVLTLAAACMLLAVSVGNAETGMYGPEHQRCAGKSTPDFEECLSRYRKAWDRRLDSAYQELLRANPYADDLRRAQRLWLKFRDANCHYYGLGEGTIVRIQAAACLRYMTQQRALELEELLEN